ncbi:T9SS type A sorting domain-containing protein [Botryobacter ruber]|uniref:T9SS type A sorting domain-containing protein n=1 Tax=Botryobacter ruber TaxID=2171629 RepID=UPI000E0C23E4|nr:T9SS type A sorting domain-containing protein [Botryobacter ruber]
MAKCIIHYSLAVIVMLVVVLQAFGGENVALTESGKGVEAAFARTAVTGGIMLSAGSVSGLPGTEVVVPVRVGGFESIITCQGTIAFDASVASFVGMEQFGLPGMGNHSFGTTQAGSGTIIFSWDDASLEGKTLVEGAIIFAIRFKVTNEPGLSSGVSFVNSPAPMEFVDKNFAAVPLTLESGEVQVPEANEFYNKSGVELSLLSSWGTSRDGSGTQPINFTDPNTRFNIINYTAEETLRLSDNWLVAGASSRVVLGDNSIPVTLEITDGKSLTAGVLDLSDNATLLVNAPGLPVFGQLSLQSTVIIGPDGPESIDQNAEFGKLILENNLTRNRSRISKSVKIKGQLELKEGVKLELGDSDLELGYEAALISSTASSYVVVNGKGRLRKGIKAGNGTTLPVGNTTFNPVKIELAAGSQDDIFSISILDGVYGFYTDDAPETSSALTGKMVNKTWLISEDEEGGSDISLTLSWSEADELQGFDATSCHIKHYHNGVWDKAEHQTAEVSGTTFSVSRSGITSFSPFSVSSEEIIDLAPLPVELLHFTATAIANTAVKLSWATATERNNDFFALERSADGSEFTEIAHVSGAGTTSIRNDYSFTDFYPLAGTSYYRLRQVDHDGSFEYLPVISFSVLREQALLLSLYPNPASGSFVHVQVQGLTQNEEAQLSITDMSGKQVLSRRQSAGASSVVSTGDLKPGTYQVTIVSKAGSQTKKLVIIR